MNIHLGFLSHYVQGPSTAIRSLLDHARVAGRQAPQRLPDRTLPVRLSAETVEWLRQQAKVRECTMAEVARAYIAQRAVSELTALYQKNITSTAEFSAVLWSVLGYESESSPGEEVRGST